MRLRKKHLAFAAASHDSKMVANSHANGKFYANGDKVVVCDPKADGYYAEAHYTYTLNGNRHIQIVTASGAGKFSTFSKNLPEGK